MEFKQFTADIDAAIEKCTYNGTWDVYMDYNDSDYLSEWFDRYVAKNDVPETYEDVQCAWWDEISEWGLRERDFMVESVKEYMDGDVLRTIYDNDLDEQLRDYIEENVVIDMPDLDDYAMVKTLIKLTNPEGYQSPYAMDTSDSVETVLQSHYGEEAFEEMIDNGDDDETIRDYYINEVPQFVLLVEKAGYNLRWVLEDFFFGWGRNDFEGIDHQWHYSQEEDKFLHSLFTEIDNNAYDAQLLCAAVNLSIKDFYALKAGQAFSLSALPTNGEWFGYFNPFNGSGSIMEIDASHNNIILEPGEYEVIADKEYRWDLEDVYGMSFNYLSSVELADFAVETVSI
jgi:hypothetical protein